MKKKHNYVVFLIALFPLLFSCGEGKSQHLKKPSVKDSTLVLNWKQAAPGIDFCETNAPFKSHVNNSKLTVVRIDPEEVEFELLCATGIDKRPRTVKEWAEEYDFDIVFNAGMYDMAEPLKSRGYLKSGKHTNNPNLNPAYNCMLAFQPTDSSNPTCDIIDLECTPWNQVNKKYIAYAQGLRMLDCNGNPMNWKKGKQSCSMLVVAKDPDGKLIVVFTRSPYLHNEMIGFLGQFPMKLTHAIYMEGGPETSLYMNIGKARLEKIGSWVSDTYETDSNDHFWELPNVIGVRVK